MVIFYLFLIFEVVFIVGVILFVAVFGCFNICLRLFSVLFIVGCLLFTAAARRALVVIKSKCLYYYSCLSVMSHFLGH